MKTKDLRQGETIEFGDFQGDKITQDSGLLNIVEGGETMTPIEDTTGKSQRRAIQLTHEWSNNGAKTKMHTIYDDIQQRPKTNFDEATAKALIAKNGEKRQSRS